MEPITLTKRVARRTVSVTITRDGASFVVASSSGYRAALPACLLDDCERDRQSCTRKLDHRAQHSGMSVDAWLRHVRTHCHGWHPARVDDFAARVLRTYAKYPGGTR